MPMNINEIDEAHKSDMSDPALIGANDCGLLDRESALITKVREMEKEAESMKDAYSRILTTAGGLGMKVEQLVKDRAGLVRDLRELRYLSDKFTEVVAYNLNYFERMEKAGEVPTYHDAIALTQESRHRYRTESKFHVRTDAIVAGLISAYLDNLQDVIKQHGGEHG